MHSCFFAAVAASAAVIHVPLQAADLVDTAIAAGNLKTFVAAVEAAGFTASLRAPGPLTVLRRPMRPLPACLPEHGMHWSRTRPGLPIF